MIRSFRIPIKQNINIGRNQFLSILFLSLLFSILIISNHSNAQTIIYELDKWKFHRGDITNAYDKDFDDSEWKSVTVPHDWAIFGPFDKEIDKQLVRITQNNEEIATEKTGRTGALPFLGVGWYRTKVKLPENSSENRIIIAFDGAMSNAEVFINGKKVGSRPYGYSYFFFDISEFAGKSIYLDIAVRLESQPFSSRWYPGAGLYRKVRLIIKNKECFKHWGHNVTTPYISDDLAKINIRSKVYGDNLHVKAKVKDIDGNVVGEMVSSQKYGDEFELNIPCRNPELWSPETPNLYTAEIRLYKNNKLVDSSTIRFGIRDIKYSPEYGFQLNGKTIKFKGVCLHHDLGPLGTAINKAALKRQLTILKDLGCNAIRSSHNMPSIEQLELCDEMGFLFLAESFDEWKKPKVPNGYNLYFDNWAEKDIINLVHATRNHPCIVMWSSGNEVPDQWGSDGVKRARWLQEIFHREDPTRPVTVGMDQVKAVMENGFGAIMDIPGLNYRVHLYEEAHETFPQGILLGSETASTVSSRGIYKFPVEIGIDKTYDDLQCSSYDLEHCNWSNIPEVDFVMQDNKPWVIGEFVWTGFDYLGEPTPYDNYWPSRSSYFGLCDLAGLPKDRYYLYRSRWNKSDTTLHILPHWNWEGRNGNTTPVMVYTSFNKAELFINGKSQGIKEKNNENLLSQYRLMWMNVKYEPGTIKVVALDDKNNPVAEKSITTAEKPYGLVLEPDREIIKADGKDLCFITVSIIDKNGNVCPTSANRLNVEVSGDGRFRAICNGDATSLEMFHKPTMKAFNGKLVIIIESTVNAGVIGVTVSGKGLKKQKLTINSKNTL